ncbi:structure-specific endonuclease subunit SLX4 isoform X1 [Drosophila bipectinata]|uniref:structure-specific endonuclease subunit SLX4 isoform X1 n=1 Tax=Drosophila bipectinata TaxID=42026 RepID=UPI001C8ADDA8|nr:structure-specific endonuclease subunit SLX4 isoform X1 [Drosophila bipectinata]
MDRKTRKANFQKLQQASGKLRSTRNSNATLSLSNFFATPEDPSEGNPSKEKASPIPMDIDNSSSKIIPIRASNVFEHPGPKPKKAPKLKGSTSGSSRKGSSRSKKQPSIRHFLRNEKMFSEVTAQHCIADNFSPDDIEMALALSKSEAKKQEGLSPNDEEDAVVDFVEVNSEISTEKIRRKLEKYGFRTARKEDYKSLAVLPVVATKLSKRSKWANKFTALTLRNPKVQQKKLEEKVSNFLAQQVQTNELLEKSRWIPPYDLISSSLLSLKPHANSHILHEPSEGSIPDMSLYYVTELMEISYMPANHLLKNWNAIQGRDLSPERETSKCRQLKKQFDLVYIELEKHFEDQLKLEQEVGNELNELEKLVAENMIEGGSRMDASSTSSSPLKEPPDKRPKIVKEDRENKSLISTCSGAPSQITRCTSPDLFADSDEEPDVATATVLNKSQNFKKFCDKDLNNFSENECLISEPIESSLSNEAPDVKDFSLKVYKNISLSEPSPLVEELEDFSQITSYEIFSSSSDEVKTVTKVTEEKNTSDDKGNIDYAAFLNHSLDDLTDISKNLNEDNPELKDNIRVFDESKILTVDSNDENEFCPISQELYMKYAKMDKQASLVEDKEDIFLDFESDFHSMDNLSFQLDKVHSSLNDTKERFSELNSRNSLKRNVSFSNDQSFKNPLNWKINSPVKNGVPSPCEYSDASIDLTLNNSDENEAILLSDEEINYSIWKANKSIKIQDFDEASSDSFSSPIIKKSALPHFQTEDDLDAFLMDFPGDKRGSKSSRSPNKSILSKERAEFGILDAAPSQPLFLSQILSPSKQPSPSYNDINWSEASFLDEPVKPLARKSIHKFDDLFNRVTRPESESDNDFDEFDQLVFQKSKDTTDSMPNGLDSLLIGEIKLPGISGTPKKDSFNVQLEVEGNMYNVRACPTPKPDFAALPEAQILQQLYNYGMKPLKRKQAVKMLEFIYNQTHPIMQATFAEDFPPREAPLFRSKSSPVIKDISKYCNYFSESTHEACLTPTETRNNFKFKNATGEELLRFSQSMTPSLCDDFEFYVLQTNVTKKTSQPLVPLHIAWHNLLCANSHLYESVLMYEPIDLQEVYLHLKQMGHRFDPKDLKSFFDRRCIIFRYDLTAPGKQAERHIQKHPKRASKKK